MGRFLNSRASQKTCHNQLINIQLSGERHEDSRMRVILQFSFFFYFPEAVIKKNF